MPVYEYRCEKGHTFEAIQRMADDALSACEVCGAAAQRVLHAPAIHFKGSGFHNTDYVTKKRPRDGDGASSDGASSGASDGASANGSGGDAPKVKEATPKDTAARTTGP